MASPRRRALARRRGVVLRLVRPVGNRAGRLPGMRAATWIEPGRLVAGRHPCAWSTADAPAEVHGLIAQGVTLFLDLTENGELAPYAEIVPASARHVRLAVRDFTVPTDEQITSALDTIDAEIAAGGIV